MSRTIGIHLGRRNSIAAFKGSQIEIVTADDNTPPARKLTPSVVAYEQGKLLVGDKAYNQLRADPENVIASIMDLMGRDFGDPAVQKQKSQFSYKITQSTRGTDNSIDEKIYKELQQAIDDLNALNLASATVEEAMKLAVPVV